MINLNELERQWKDYKRKTFLPFIYLVMGLLGVGFLLFFILSSLNVEEKNIVKSTLPEMKPPIAVTELNQTKLLVKEKTLPKQEVLTAVHKPKNELKPSFAFMKQIKPVKQYEKRTVKPHNTKPIQKKSYVQPKVNETKHYSTITTSQSEDKLKTLILRFNRSKNPQLGIVIAQNLLDIHDYKKAYNFALEVNALDQTNTQSWIIAAKALYFRDKKDAAKQLLNTFLRRGHSSQASKLLQKIEAGTVK